LLSRLFKDTVRGSKFPYVRELQELVRENARRRRSDGTVWALYYANLYNVPIDEGTAKEIVSSRDCLSLLLLYFSGDPTHQTRVIGFASGLDRSDLYELDQYWLLLYELFFAGKIASPYMGEDAFEVLKSNAVSFLKVPSAT
jgi:hypothetical protein